jgi:hypothetical protein
LLDLEEAVLVKGLKANLTSISQLCDQDLKANFTKEECLVTSDKRELLKGSRSKDNYHVWGSEEYLTTCLISQGDGGILLGYSVNNKAYKVLNNRTMMKPTNVIIDDCFDKVHDAKSNVVTSFPQPEDSKVEEKSKKIDP